MSSWLLCLKCDPPRIIKSRSRRTYTNRKKQCHQCWSTKLIELSDNQLAEFLNKGKLPAWIYKGKKYKGLFRDLKRAAAPKPRSKALSRDQVEDQEKEPGPQYPGCFGKRYYLDQNKGINEQECIDQWCFEECRKKAKR